MAQTAMSVGNVMSEPDPTTVLIIPTPMPARTMITASVRVTEQDGRRRWR